MSEARTIERRPFGLNTGQWLWTVRHGRKVWDAGLAANEADAVRRSNEAYNRLSEHVSRRLPSNQALVGVGEPMLNLDALEAMGDAEE